MLLSKSLRENNKKTNTADILTPTHLSRDQTETTSGRKQPVFVIKHCLIEPYLSLTRTQVSRKFAVMSHSVNQLCYVLKGGIITSAKLEMQLKFQHLLAVHLLTTTRNGNLEMFEVLQLDFCAKGKCKSNKQTNKHGANGKMIPNVKTEQQINNICDLWKHLQEGSMFCRPSISAKEAFKIF